MCDRHRRVLSTALSCLMLAGLAWAGLAWGADWPTYRHDNNRSAVTAEALVPPLAEAWRFKPRHAPELAWQAPRNTPVEGILELARVEFDNANYVAAAKGTVYFGTSADNKVYALDAATGQPRWVKITGAPVRLAPTVWQDRIYVGSDDGFAYCLEPDSGKEVWKRRVGPNGKRLLGSGKMISYWPLRTGIIVDKGIAYMAAGIWPAEGIYLEALRADNGELVWRNDSCGEVTDTGMSPQGYLLASASTLFVPQGRVSPAAFDRSNGRLLYGSYFGKQIGGTYALLADDLLYTGTEEMLSYRQKTRGRFAWFQGRQLIVTKDVSYMASDKELVGLSRKTYPKASLKRLALRGQRARMRRAFYTPRREKRKLDAALKKNQANLAALDKQIAALGDNAKPEDAAALKAKRDAAQKALEATQNKLDAVQKTLDQLRAQQEKMEKEGQAAANTMTASATWRIAAECPDSLILAGNVLYAGGDGHVIAVDAASGEKLWTAQVDGRAKGLAVADGRLYVSTDKGMIHCFAAPGAKAVGEVAEPTKAEPFPRDGLTPVYAAAGEQIVRESGVTRGYALVLGCETGRLALELAKRTKLMIYAVDPDQAKVAAARAALDSTGLYGTRICVDQGSLSDLPYSDYFADLVVSERALLGSLDGCSAAEVARVQKPCGGVVMIGQPAKAKGRLKVLDPAALRQWAAVLPAADVDGGWLKSSRPALEGAGEWTHEYADAGNTTCSYDSVVKAPLGLLWFGRPGPLHMISRHRRAAAPLSVNGVLFIQGEDLVSGYDAYNGLKLWEYPIPHVVRATVSHDCSNLAADEHSFFVVTGTKCLRLEGRTGKLLATYQMPKPPADQKRLWGYVACDRGVLFGSRTARSRYTDALFAIDVDSGKLKWVHKVTSVPHPSISVGDGRLFYVDSKASAAQRQQALAERIKSLSASEAARVLKTAPVRTAVALDAASGKVLWQQPLDLTGCVGGAYWSALGTMYRKGALVVFGIYSDGHYWRYFFAGQFESRRVIVLSASDGSETWSKNIGYRVRPLIIGETLHAEPWAYDLRTGEQRMRINPVTGQKEPWQFARPGHHCGLPAASLNCLFFRSYYLGYYDLVRDTGTMHFGGQRPGCWLNFIVANGLVMMPEASSGCMCPFANQCTLVFKPRKEDRAWTKSSLSTGVMPVKHLALNLGMAGDRKDAAGALWLGYPRPGGSLVLQFKIGLSGYPGGGYFKQSPDFLEVANTPDPWLYASGYNGVRRCIVPVLGKGDGSALYTVRLGFADIENDKPGVRVFDVKIQGKPVLKGFDPAKEAGGRCRAIVKEFNGIESAENITIDFTPAAAKPQPNQLPILQSVEVVRERVLTLGFTVPAFLLNNAEREQGGKVRIANNKDNDFVGKLVAAAPDGFAVEPAETPVKVASGGKALFALRAKALKQMPRGKYAIKIKLLRQDGTVECERESQIEYLADRGRVVLKAAEDAWVSHGSPGSNYGTRGSVVVDGGNAKMGDSSHNVGYLKFKLDAVRGKPLTAVLRLYNAGNPSSNGGNICLVTEPWKEKKITYINRPKPGKVLGNVGRVEPRQTLEVPLKLSIEGMKELSLCIDPVNCDGTDYVSREGGKPAELVVEYEAK